VIMGRDACWYTAIIAPASSPRRLRVRRRPVLYKVLMGVEVEVRDDHGLELDRPAHDERGVLDQPRGRRQAVALGAGDQVGDRRFVVGADVVGLDLAAVVKA
jgi:hypothetical protein